MGCTVVALGLGLSQAGAAAPVRRQMKVNVSGPMLASRACGAARQGVSRQAPRAVVVRASDDDKSEEVKYNTEFGYSRKDVLLIGFGLIGGGVLFKWGLEVAGVDPIMAGTVAVVSPRPFVCPVDRVLSSRIWPSSLRRPYIKSPGRDWRTHARTNAPTHARTHQRTHSCLLLV